MSEARDTVTSELDRLPTLVDAPENGSRNGDHSIGTNPLSPMKVLELFWEQRGLILRSVLVALLIFTIAAFLPVTTQRPAVRFIPRRESIPA